MTGRRGRAWARAGAALGAVPVLLLVLAGVAGAHPLGNFTSNTASRLVVGPDATRIDYVLDLAEVPTVLARQEADADGDGTVGDAEGERWGAARCAAIADIVELRVDGDVVPVTAGGQQLELPPGAGGLPTLRLSCALLAATGPLATDAVITYEDTSLQGRVGWREVVAVGDRTTLLASDVPDVSPSALLTAYPQQSLRSPLAVVGATLRVDPSGGPAAPPPPVPVEDPAPRTGGLEGLATSFTELVGRQELTLAFGALAVVLAILLGGLHALAPGHGKAVMAAYLVGGRGALREALWLGGAVAVAHTAGVLLLGVVVTTTDAVAPERLYPVLGAASGALFAAIGVVLLRRALRGEHGHVHGPGGHTHGPADHGHVHGSDGAHGGPGHAHDHGDDGHGDHDHVDDGHHDHDHDHGPVPVRTAGLRPVGGGVAVVDAAPPVPVEVPALAPAGQTRPTRSPWRTAVVPGLAGGLTPSPSALVVLLGGVALGRAWFGVLLVVAYGIGLAGALVIGGVALHRLRRRLEGRTALARWAERARVLPIVTAVVIIVGGAVIAVRALLA